MPATQGNIYKRVPYTLLDDGKTVMFWERTKTFYAQTQEVLYCPKRWR
jgi:hypothetical protein